MDVDTTLRWHKGNSKLQISDPELDFSEVILIYMCYKDQYKK